MIEALKECVNNRRTVVIEDLTSCAITGDLDRVQRLAAQVAAYDTVLLDIQRLEGKQ